MYYLLLLIGIFRLFFPPIDPDFGWHYKYGEYFMQHLALLKDNIFSYNLVDYKWFNSYWLAEVILYVSHHFLGDVFAGIVFSTIFAFTLLFFIKTKSTRFATVAITYLIAVTVCANVFITVRPMFFSTLFWIALAEILVYAPKYKRYLPLIFLLWANMHAEFLIGLFVFGIYSIDFTVQMWRRKNYKAIIENTIIFGGSLFVTLVNPYGINLWTTLLKELSQPFKADVGEWKPLSISFESLPSFVLLTILLPATVMYAKAKKSFWYGVIGIFFALFSFKSTYMIRLLVIFSIPTLIWLLDFLTKDRLDKFKLLRMWVMPIMYGIAAVYLVTFIKNVADANNMAKWSRAWQYPYDAVQILQTQKPTGNLFNIYWWGGYLIWQLPTYKTFVDGRMTSWRDTNGYIINTYHVIHDAPDKNSALVDYYFQKNNIRYVLDMPDSPLVTYLMLHGWIVDYKNEYSILLERKDVFAYR